MYTHKLDNNLTKISATSLILIDLARILESVMYKG